MNPRCNFSGTAAGGTFPGAQFSGTVSEGISEKPFEPCRYPLELPSALGLYLGGIWNGDAKNGHVVMG